MDNGAKINHMCKLLGIIFVLLAITVFANATTYSLNCSNTFNCSIKDYCQGIPGANPALIVHNGTAISYSLGAQPTTYYFNSNTTGEHFCSATVKVTAMHDQGQTNETTSIYINGTLIGTTKDNYCNSSSGSCTFCGIDSQKLPTKIVNLSQNNAVKIEGHDSHGVVAVIIDCSPSGNPSCENNLAPFFQTIQDKTIHYSSSFTIDLWDYMRDYDNSLSSQKISFSLSNNNISCSLDNNRYLICNASTLLGNTNVKIKATDICDNNGEVNFNVTVINNPPILSVPDKTESCAADLNNFIDLRKYSVDENVNDLNYQLLSQSNAALLSCSITDKYFVSCTVNSCSDNYSELVVRATDDYNLFDDDAFKIFLKNTPPYWIKNLPTLCLNYEQFKFIDLKEYVYDLEDKNDLDFNLSQSNSSAVNCFIEDNYYLSCNNISNLAAQNVLTVIAIDSEGLTAQKQMTINTNCFDNNKGHYAFYSETKGICLESCTSYTTQLTLKNDTSESQCFNFDLDYIGSFNVSLGKNNFCLGKGQTTLIPLSANTCQSDFSHYSVIVSDTDQNLSLTFDYDIGACNNFDGFRLTEFDGKVCQGEKRTFPVEVRNTSTQTKTINLLAENEMILPYFGRNSVTLNSGQTKNVDLTINARNASLGYYSIMLGGDATNYHIEKKLEVEVVDCSDIQKRNFIIGAPSVCYDVSRGQIFEGSFSVKRLNEGCGYCSANEKNVLLYLTGMPNELAYNQIGLRYSQEKSIDFSVFVPANAPAGPNFLTISGEEVPLTAFDTDIGFIDDEQICLNVLGESSSTITVRTQAKDIFWCDSEIFEFEVINTGDFDENFSLTATAIPYGINVSFSQNQITVPKGQSKIVYVSVATTPLSQIMDNQSITVNLSGRINLSSRMYFNVKEKPFFDDLEILSATKELSLGANSTGEYVLVLRNNTERELTNISIAFENVPVNVTIPQTFIDSLQVGEIRTVRGNVIVGDTNGYFAPVFVVSSGTIINKKQFGLLITKSEFGSLGAFFALGAGAGNSGATGLFALSGDGLTIGLIVSLFLTLLLLTIILGVAYIYNKPKKEVWVEVDLNE